MIDRIIQIVAFLPGVFALLAIITLAWVLML
jgi:hypothetical protein